MDAVLAPRLATEQLARLEAYLAGFRGLFSRADQARSFGLYVRGLLDGDHRKNVESIADRVRDAHSPAADLAQSLQHFVTQSPWDTGRVLAQYRSIVQRNRSAPTWVVHDGIIPKKGRHSVGVHRQFARSLGRKVNCQLAVVISDVTAACVPLAGRLYLPGQWLRDHEGGARRTVPELFQSPRSKPEVALELIEELLAEGRPALILAEESYLAASKFRDGLNRLGIATSDEVEQSESGVSLARDCFDHLKDQIGLSHFEGRTWSGWHHHLALVFAAFGFLVHQGVSDDNSGKTFPSLPTK
jgi:SRSO17 transposase